MAASFPSNACEMALHGLPQVDEALLMAFLEESQPEEIEDERLLCVIRSLQQEIDCKNDVEPEAYRSHIEVDADAMEEADGNCSGSDLYNVDDKFDWVAMDVGQMGGWYVDIGSLEEAAMAELGGEAGYGASWYWCAGGEADPAPEQEDCTLWDVTNDYYYRM